MELAFAWLHQLCAPMLVSPVFTRASTSVHHGRDGPSGPGL
jgi:hypothetical protein